MIAPRAILESSLAKSLRCAVCRGALSRAGDELVCMQSACGARFPVVDGVPVLINESQSVFEVRNIAAGKHQHGAPKVGLKKRVLEALPSLSANVSGRSNLTLADQLIRERSDAPSMLIVGGGGLGNGLDQMVFNPAYNVVESDVYIGPRTNLVCDAHDIPFAESTFDAVVIQGVLHAVLDPERGVSEIHRVLKPGGLVYAEVPFAQQICEGRFDFYRFSHLGLRRLFRHFEEVRSGAQGGPGMAAAWAYQHFLLSLASTKRGRSAARVFARLTAFWLPYFDRYLVSRPAGIDAASGVYFLGRRSDVVLSDRELITQYRGWTEATAARA
jgi:SAM-dependent methyltransferase